MLLEVGLCPVLEFYNKLLARKVQYKLQEFRNTKRILEITGSTVLDLTTREGPSCLKNS